MSWSFSVTQDNSADASREFANKLAESAAHIPERIGRALDDGANSLIACVEDDRRITLSSSGHFNSDGTGNCSLTLYSAKIPAPEPMPTPVAG